MVEGYASRTQKYYMAMLHGPLYNYHCTWKARFIFRELMSK
jgi:hypothetical protein